LNEITPDKFRIYRNINRKIWTIQTYRKGIGWRKDGEAKFILSMHNTYKVYESGRKRVKKEKKKNVHAYVEAISIVGFNKERDMIEWFKNNTGQEYILSNEVVYNPYHNKTFIYKGGGEVRFTYINSFRENGELWNLQAHTGPDIAPSEQEKTE